MTEGNTLTSGLHTCVHTYTPSKAVLRSLYHNKTPETAHLPSGKELFEELRSALKQLKGVKISF